MSHYEDEEQVEALKKWWQENWKALAAGLVLGRDWEECLRQGAESAASVIGDIGARSFYSSASG